MDFCEFFMHFLIAQKDDDFIDRLNYFYTCMLLISFSILISAGQYVGKPIQCWVPAQFRGAWEQYAENYCFVQNTYWLPMKEDIPRNFRERETREISYYQWLPFLLAVQAVFFYFPCFIWRIFNWKTGFAINQVSNIASQGNNISDEIRLENVAKIANHLSETVTESRHYSKVLPRHKIHIFLSKHYISILYITVKCLYIINLIGQFFLLEYFLNYKNSSWGFQVMRSVLSGEPWEESGNFPRVTICDFEVRSLGNIHRYSIQCVLMINMFNEKIFIFIYWYLMFVTIVTIINTLYWLQFLLTSKKNRFALRFLRVAAGVKERPPESDTVAESQKLNHVLGAFIKNTLNSDAILVMKLICINAGDLITTDLFGYLWKSHNPPPLYIEKGDTTYV